MKMKLASSVGDTSNYGHVQVDASLMAQCGSFSSEDGINATVSSWKEAKAQKKKLIAASSVCNADNYGRGTPLPSSRTQNDSIGHFSYAEGIESTAESWRKAQREKKKQKEASVVADTSNYGNETPDVSFLALLST